ncbi:unnamed protein product [Urochloa humidicola]
MLPFSLQNPSGPKISSLSSSTIRAAHAPEELQFVFPFSYCITCSHWASQVIPSMQLHTSKKCTKKESINMTIVKLGKLN